MSVVPMRKHEAGVTMIVALILLVIMTLIGLAGVRAVALEERMTSNTFDRALGFQGTEAALRAAETAAQAQADAIPPNKDFNSYGVYTDADSSCGTSACVNGLCSQPDKDCTARWLDSSFTGWQDTSSLGLTSNATAPQYFVEFLGGDFPCDIDNPDTGAQDCNRYRITARSRTADTADRSMVILQTIYATE
jgi:type IV pilus assembly protein PilX